ncbi:hypothetical protein CsSME_00031814 [Camellia sinensis var. sinensis]
MRNGPGTFCVLKFVELDVQLKLAEAYWEFLYLQYPFLFFQWVLLTSGPRAQEKDNKWVDPGRRSSQDSSTFY